MLHLPAPVVNSTWMFPSVLSQVTHKKATFRTEDCGRRSLQHLICRRCCPPHVLRHVLSFSLSVPSSVYTRILAKGERNEKINVYILHFILNSEMHFTFYMWTPLYNIFRNVIYANCILNRAYFQKRFPFLTVGRWENGISDLYLGARCDPILLPRAVLTTEKRQYRVMGNGWGGAGTSGLCIHFLFFLGISCLFLFPLQNLCISIYEMCTKCLFANLIYFLAAISGILSLFLC
jgi:hypothetical protein